MRVIFLDLDTLRPDHLGCYGYHRDTSPNIDRIAKQGVRFTNYYCSDAPCLPSRAALFTGQFGIHTGIVGHGGTAADMRLEGASRGFCGALAQRGGQGQSLPLIFQRAGLRTASISPFPERHSAWWFNAGFCETYNTGKGGNESVEDVTPTVLDWVKRNAKQDDWFLHVNYWDAHDPYRVPESFGNPFEDDPLPDWITPAVLEQHRKAVGPSTARELNMFGSEQAPGYPRDVPEIRTIDDLRRHVDGYDCGISYMDSHLGQLFDALEAEGAMDDLVILISTDHGENHGELGIYKEHGTADYATCHIPMIVHWPGGASGHVDDGLHYGLDLAPTLAELFEQEPHPAWDGQSYAAAITQGDDCGRDSLVLSQCAHVCQRSVRFGPWLYIRTYHDGYHLFPTEMLFNVVDDPHEQHNLVLDHPHVCREAVYALNQWHDDMMATMPDAVDPLWTVVREGGPYHPKGQLRQYCERLEKTERGWAVPELKKRHPGEFV